MSEKLIDHEFVGHTAGPERDCTAHGKCHKPGCMQPLERHRQAEKTQDIKETVNMSDAKCVECGQVYDEETERDLAQALLVLKALGLYVSKPCKGAWEGSVFVVATSDVESAEAIAAFEALRKNGRI